MKLVMIAAIGAHNQLGFNGDMPWKRSLSSDLKFFRQTTAHHPMVMGRKTFESLPGLLPGREHLVITSSKLPAMEHVQTYPNLDSFLQAWKDSDQTIYVIGGGSIYRQFLPYADELILTEIDSDFDADTWFPTFDASQYDQTLLDTVEENGYIYRHIRYRRKPDGQVGNQAENE
ncbi:dihydrofolate reductase [Erysipelotrichaceae bacterium 51-3]|uniref:dihydrofolate reductase n=1 Tax=Allobaculum sp. JKK-2023 TaxID=3108943 RepID=UPI002B061AF1|nr:dihydrofolate reductase [Allobaculum sp. JKK-2023]